MTYVSLQLSDELKLRASSAAKALGISTHAFMVDAIRQAAVTVEQRMQFVAWAQAARVEMLHSGQGMDADEVRAYVRARLADPASSRPGVKPWRA